MFCRGCTQLKASENFGIKAFTLIELLVTISTIGVLLAILLPSLQLARQKTKTVVCLNNLRQLGYAFHCYANDYDSYAMACYEPGTDTYWWGQKLSGGIDHEKGFVWPYLKSGLGKNSVYECPTQKYGTYRLQGKPGSEPDSPKWLTSTYGYNGYYLSPPVNPWPNIRDRPWQRITTVIGPDKVIAFADTMLDWDFTGTSPYLENNALVDPPYILAGNCMSWEKNLCPTTCFRHNDKANVVFVDGHCQSMPLGQGQYTSPKAKIGSIGKDQSPSGRRNYPHYIPDYQQWLKKRRQRN